MTDDVATIMAFVAWATAAVCGVWLYARRAHPRGRKVRAADGHTVRIRGPRDPTLPTRPPRYTPPLDPLARLEAEWLADERPAWETVAEFERDVDRAMGLRARPRSEAVPF